MGKELKNNVNVFNRDAKEQGGYQYFSTSGILAAERISKAILENIPPDCKTLIDLGCGDGTNTERIRTAKPSLAIDATDPAGEAVKVAQKKYPAIRFFVSNILDEATFQNAAKHYDAALFIGVLHHLSDPVLAISNALQLADTLIIQEPNGNNPIVKLIEKTSKYHIEHEERSWSSKTMIKFCEQAGGKVEKLFFINYVPVLFPAIPARIIHFFQPLLERIPLLRTYFSGQMIILCRKA